MTIVKAGKTVLECIGVVVCLAAVLVPVSAQTQTQPQNQPQTQGQPTGAGDTSQQTEPKVEREQAPGLSFLNGLLPEMRVPVGFAVGISHTYAPDPLSHGEFPDQSTTLNPRLFSQIRKKGFQFNFDYEFGFRRYNKKPSFRSYDHTASMTMSKELSRRVSLTATNQVRSSYNDSAFSPNFSQYISATSLRDLSGFSHDVYTNRQKQTRDSASLDLNFRLWKKTGFGVFGGYDYLKYDKDRAASQSVSAGIRTSYQFKKWVSFDTSYSTYLNTIDERLRTSSIQRLQFLGFRYKLRRNIEAFTSGGIEQSRFRGGKQTTGSFEAGLARIGKSNHLSLMYHRGLSSAFGGGIVLGGHNVTLSFSQSLTRRLSLNLDSSYIDGRSSLGSVLQSASGRASLRSITGTASLGVALTRHMFFSTNYSYISQRASNLYFNSDTLHRYVVSAGVYYSLPSLFGRSRGY